MVLNAQECLAKARAASQTEDNEASRRPGQAPDMGVVSGRAKGKTVLAQQPWWQNWPFIKDEDHGGTTLPRFEEHIARPLDMRALCPSNQQQAP